MPGPVALLDACVLVPVGLCDSLPSMALVGTFWPKWSDTILDEVSRHLPQLAAADVADRLAAMNDAFPEALVRGWRPRLAAVPNAVNPKDRHVVVAALKARAGVIVTDNLSDFAPEELAALGVEVRTADDFLASWFDIEPTLAATAFRHQLERLQRPPRTAQQHIDMIRSALPKYAQRLSMHLAEVEEPPETRSRKEISVA